MSRTVKCVKLGRELAGLERPPFPGEFGQRIFENVSQQGWEMWKDHQILLINHYGLNLADSSATSVLMEEMEKFFFGDDARVPEDWVPEGEGSGAGLPGSDAKGAPSGKGAPGGKGAPAKGAPQRK